MAAIYYSAQAGWGPDDFYALYRYLDRMFSSNKTHREPEIRDLDLTLMTDETKHLIWHLLILQGGMRDMMRKYPNLRPLLTMVRNKELNPQLPIVLGDPPTHAYAYFQRNNIHL